MHDTREVELRAVQRPLSPGERRQRNRQEMLDLILLHARQIMREEGVAALSLRELARRLRFTVQALYKYYPSKAALYDALFRLGNEYAAEHMKRFKTDGKDPWEQLGAMIEGYMSFAQQYPELWSLVFERPVPGFSPSAESMQVSREMLGQAQGMVRRFMESGAIRPGLSPEQATDFLDAVMHGLTAAHMANQPELPAGTGRFGSLIPATVRFFRAAWGVQEENQRKEYNDAGADGARG